MVLFTLYECVSVLHERSISLAKYMVGVRDW
jgi:hypothetical protein